MDGGGLRPDMTVSQVAASGVEGLAFDEAGQHVINLNVHRCRLTELPDLSALVNLQTLDCAYNQLPELPGLSTLTNLRELDCSNNRLTELPDVSALVDLERLYCAYNQLTQLPDTSALVQLQYCSFNGNPLTLTDAEREEIQRRLPKCRFYW